MNLAVNRKLTTAFIAQLPIVLVLTPRERNRTSAGGYAWLDFAPRAPQTMTLIETGGVGGLPRPTVTENGQVRVVEFTIVGEWDAKLERHDTFTHQGRDWEVIELFYENGYERRALVTARG